MINKISSVTSVPKIPSEKKKHWKLLRLQNTLKWKLNFIFRILNFNSQLAWYKRKL